MAMSAPGSPPELAVSRSSCWIATAVGDTVYCRRWDTGARRELYVPRLRAMAQMGPRHLWVVDGGYLRRFCLGDGDDGDGDEIGPRVALEEDSCGRLIVDPHDDMPSAIWAGADHVLVAEDPDHNTMVTHRLPASWPRGAFLRPAGAHSVLMAADEAVWLYDLNTRRLAWIRVPAAGRIIAAELSLMGQWLMVMVEVKDGIELLFLGPEQQLLSRLLLPRFDLYAVDRDLGMVIVRTAEERTVGIVSVLGDSIRYMPELAEPIPAVAMHLHDSPGVVLIGYAGDGSPDARDDGDCACGRPHRPPRLESTHHGFYRYVLSFETLRARAHARLLRQPGASMARASAPLFRGQMKRFLVHELRHGRIPTLHGLDAIGDELFLGERVGQGQHYTDPDKHIGDLLHLCIYKVALLIGREWHDGALVLDEQQLEAGHALMQKAVRAPLLELRALIELVDMACRGFAYRIQEKTDDSLQRAMCLPFVQLCDDFALSERDAELLLYIAGMELSPLLLRLVTLLAQGKRTALTNEAFLAYAALGDAPADETPDELEPTGFLRHLGLVHAIPAITMDRGARQRLVAHPVVLSRLRGEPCASTGSEAFTTMLAPEPPIHEVEAPESLKRALIDAVADRRPDGAPHCIVLVVREGDAGAGWQQVLAALAARAGKQLAAIDCQRLLDAQARPAEAAAALREALLCARIRGALVCLFGLDAARVSGKLAAVAALWPVIHQHAAPLFVCASEPMSELAPSAIIALD